MIKFDANSIYNRLLERMQRDENWKIISNNSVVSSLLRSTSEVNAETARYAEYLFKESKWDSAQNPSSILAMARMLGYQPSRKISARGTLKVSTDPRIHLIGASLSAALLDEGSTESQALLKNYKWQKPSLNREIQIGPECTIKDSKGNNYIASPKIFTNNTFFTSIDIMQGIRKTAEIDIDTIRDVATSSKLDPYLYIPITIKNCENAGDPLSRSYFKVKIKKSVDNKINYTEYRVTSTLLMSTLSDYDVEVYNDMYNQDLFYLKFNNDPSRGNILDISPSSNILGIQVSYVESNGAQGNLSDLFDDFILTNVPAVVSGDSTNKSFIKLYGTNPKVISGGKDEESIEKIRENAPKYYMKNYTAGTKEAYENTISNLVFNINGKPTPPKRVRVYGGFSERRNKAGQEIIQPVTYITFLADGLEDLIQKDIKDPYKDIEKALNYYLYKLKSPQDTLKFVPPSYVSFAVGINCKVNREDVPDLTSMSLNIRNLIESEWGPDSEKLDFGKSFFPSQFESLIHSNFPPVVTMSTEIEAVTKASWSSAKRIRATGTENTLSLTPGQDISSNIEPGREKHTFRIYYEFNPVFLGNQSLKGFRGGENGATYIMRIDVMYKRPLNLSVSSEFHTSIFIEDIPNRSKEAFYIRNTSQDYLWTKNILETGDEYKMLQGNKTAELLTSRQFYYKDHLYTDNDYTQLLKQVEEGEVSLIKDYRINLGCLDDYLIYFSPNYSQTAAAESAGGGWIELSFEPIYEILSRFAIRDSSLAKRLRDCPLSNLNCGQTGLDNFGDFKNILRDYVDIYVSMRPIDPELIIPVTNNIEETNKEENSAVLYIDSKDSSIRNRTELDQSQVLNLTSSKRNRMISIECSYRE